MPDQMEEIQKKLGVRFNDELLLKAALTHSSYVHEHKLSPEQSNERLEFLGDAVLGLCIAEMLIQFFPQEPEGALSKRRAALVNQKQLVRIAEELGLGPALLIGKGEEKTGGRTKASLLGDAVEALIGSLFLDQGLGTVQKTISRLFSELIPISKKVETSQDYKTKLQEQFQSSYKRSPRYQLVKESGPDHSKTFEVAIEFQGKRLSTGVGKSKREAEQDSARRVLENLSALELPPPLASRRNKKSGKSKIQTKSQKGMAP